MQLNRHGFLNHSLAALPPSQPLERGLSTPSESGCLVSFLPQWANLNLGGGDLMRRSFANGLCPVKAKPYR